MVDHPTIQISDLDTRIIHVFHLWNSVQSVDGMEVTDRPTNSGNVNDAIRTLSPTMRFSIVLAGSLIVPSSSSTSLFQDRVFTEQVLSLRGLNGHIVQVKTRALDITGMIINVEISDDGRYDSQVIANIEVKQVSRGLGAGSVTLGEIFVPAVQDPGATDHIDPDTTSGDINPCDPSLFTLGSILLRKFGIATMCGVPPNSGNEASIGIVPETIIKEREIDTNAFNWEFVNDLQIQIENPLPGSEQTSQSTTQDGIELKQPPSPRIRSS